MQKTQHSFELGSSWQTVLQEELAKEYMGELAEFLEQEYTIGSVVYPPRELIFNAFKKTPFEKVQVLILGQDPYHGEGQAHGLAFSVPEGIKTPPSLKNIFKELHSDLGVPVAAHGCLENWAKQGVLLLNTTLTVRDGEPLSHVGQGWERFTDAVIAKLAARNDPVIFVLWGKSAQLKLTHLTNESIKSRHLILQAAHPSPLSAHNGFLGCRHFSTINQQLTKNGKTPISW